MRRLSLLLLPFILLAGCAGVPMKQDLAGLQKQVADAERGFAKTMADRNFAAFGGFIADEAVFFTSTTALRGKPAVVEFWKRFYEKPEAPFSWEPAQVEVLDSGTLAISFGPVRDPSGKHVSIRTRRLGHGTASSRRRMPAAQR